MTLPMEALETRRLLAFMPIQLGNKGYDSGQETAVDASGNTIVAGIFQHTVDFGLDPHLFHTPESAAPHLKLTAVGETDVFIAKYDPNGNLVWAGQIGGEESKLKQEQLPIDPARGGININRSVGIEPSILGEYVNGLAVDSAGNVFLTGAFLKSADLDPTPGVAMFSANPKYNQYYDAYLIKLTAGGSLAWADTIGGQFNDVGNGVAIDPQGNPVVTGYFTRRADFDPTSKGDFSLDASGREDIFVAKYTAAGGKLVWVDRFGGEATKAPDRDSGNGVAVDEDGQILVTGTFSDKVDFDPGPAVVLKKTKKRTGTFLLGLSPRGKRTFVQTFGGNEYDGGAKVATRNGAIYVASYFSGQINPNPDKGTATFISNGDDRHTDLLISKYNSDGKFDWAKPIGGPGFETVGGLAVGADDSVYMSGGFYEKADFDPGPGTTYLTSTLGDDKFNDANDNGRKFSYDIFVSRLSTNGKFLNATRIGSSGDDFGTGLSVATDGTIALAGQFRNTVAFAGASRTPFKRKSRGLEEAFLIELDKELSPKLAAAIPNLITTP